MEQKEVKLNKGWTIQRSVDGKYMAYDKNLDIFMHGDMITLSSDNLGDAFIRFYMSGLLIGSIWITTGTTVKRVKELIREVEGNGI